MPLIQHLLFAGNQPGTGLPPGEKVSSSRLGKLHNCGGDRYRAPGTCHMDLKLYKYLRRIPMHDHRLSFDQIPSGTYRDTGVLVVAHAEISQLSVCFTFVDHQGLVR